MGSVILRFVRPANLQAWVASNAPGSLKATGRESWRAYLVSQGAVGSTLFDLENSFTPSAPTLLDAWGQKISASTGATTKEKARALYK